MSVETDQALLEEVLELERLSDKQRATFDDIQRKTVDRGYPMTPKQRGYCLVILGRGEMPVEYENLISSGKAPRGREVQSMVGPLAMKPPGRK